MEAAPARPQPALVAQPLMQHAQLDLAHPLRQIGGVPIGVGEAWQLQKRYRRHRDKLFVCLRREDVEPTNNGSERDLRNSVIHDKVTGGYRSRRGAEQGAIFATLLTTARKRGQNAYARLCSIAGPSALRVAGTAT
jgi:hypothetical protein